MDDAQFLRIETLCYQFYNSPLPEERRNAEQVLLAFSEDVHRIPACRELLTRSSSMFALAFSANSLLKLVTRHVYSLTIEDKVDLRTISFSQGAIRTYSLLGSFLLNILGTRPTLEPVVINAIVQLFCRLTKLAWFEGEIFRNELDELTKFLAVCKLPCFNHTVDLIPVVPKAPPEYVNVGLLILSQLCYEMNTNQPSKNLAKQRKVAI